MQRTGAYKVRGAYYKISQLSPEERSRGLITASAGNHAQGVAYAAKLAGVKATVVMPVTTPLIKVNRTKSYGADVVLYGNVFDEACAHAYELADEHGYTFVHPFNDLKLRPARAALRWRSSKNSRLWITFSVPVGGGGLCTGVSTLAKLLNPKIKVIAVEPTGAACLKASLEAGEVIHRLQDQHDRGRYRCPDAGRQALPVSSGKRGSGHHSGRLRTDSFFPRYGRES